MQFYRRMQARKTRQYDEHVRLGEDYYPVNDLEELPACLAGHMPNLQTLSLYVSYCPVLPALQHLVHLEVSLVQGAKCKCHCKCSYMCILKVSVSHEDRVQLSYQYPGTAVILLGRPHA